MNQDTALSIWFTIFLIFVLALIHSSFKLKGAGQLLFALLQQKIEESLHGYRQRQRNEYHGVVNWSCSGKRFDLLITLQQRYWTCSVSIWFHCAVNRSFQIRFDKGVLKTNGVDDAYEKKLVAEPTFAGIWKNRETFDRIVVKEDRIQATKRYRRQSEIDDWPDALGALITFVRYLMDFEGRKEIASRGEPVCPYCRAAVEAQQTNVICRDCRTLHHQECWYETGRCSVFGCRSKSEAGTEARPP